MIMLQKDASRLSTLPAAREPAHGSRDFPIATYPICYKPPGEYLFYAHFHEEIESFAVLEGSAEVWVNATQYILHAGDILLIKPGSIHYAKFHSAEICDTVAVLFHRLILCRPAEQDIIFRKYLSRMDEDDFSPALVYTASQPYAREALDDLLEIIRLLSQTMRSGEELLIKSHLFHFTYLFFRYSEERNTGSSRDTITAVIRQSLSFITEHYYEDLTTAILASQVHLSVSQYERLFRRIMNRSPIAYLMEYRINMAKALLTDTTAKISEIAMSTGWRNFSYFNRCFLRFVNMTPGAFRRENNKQKGRS